MDKQIVQNFEGFGAQWHVGAILRQYTSIGVQGVGAEAVNQTCWHTFLDRLPLQSGYLLFLLEI